MAANDPTPSTVAELISAWQAGADGPSAGAAAGPLAEALVRAALTAVRRGAPGAELGRAAAAWGASLGTPAAVLPLVRALRRALAPGRPREVLETVVDQLAQEAVAAASAALTRSARTDPLTGCANRRALDEELPLAVARATRTGQDLAVAMIDLDGLKRLNDTEGNWAGDRALRQLADALGGALRIADTVYRVGGDEFVVVAPGSDASGMGAVMLRATCTGPPFSWGVASLTGVGPAAAEDPGLLVSIADADLYVRRSELRRVAAQSTARRRWAGASVAAAVLAVAGTVGGLQAAVGPTTAQRALGSDSAGTSSTTGVGPTVTAPSSTPTPASGPPGTAGARPAPEAAAPPGTEPGSPVAHPTVAPAPAGLTATATGHPSPSPAPAALVAASHPTSGQPTVNQAATTTSGAIQPAGAPAPAVAEPATTSTTGSQASPLDRALPHLVRRPTSPDVTSAPAGAGTAPAVTTAPPATAHAPTAPAAGLAVPRDDVPRPTPPPPAAAPAPAGAPPTPVETPPAPGAAATRGPAPWSGAWARRHAGR